MRNRSPHEIGLSGSIAAGGCLALASLWLLPGQGVIRTIEQLLLIGVLVVVPLAVPLVIASEAAGPQLPLQRVLVVLQPIAALLTTISFFFPAGLTAAILASSWLLTAGLIGLFGLLRLWQRGLGSSAELCVQAGMLYLPVGGAWLVMGRLGANPLGFGDVIVLLTAVHFHYAGFAAPILTGLAGGQLERIRPGLRSAFLPVAVGVIAGTPLVAIGITFSPAIEVLAAFVLATSLLGLVLLSLLVIVPSFDSRIAQGLLIVSSLAVIVPMGLAIAYAVGEFAQVSIVGIQQMVRLHGWFNAIGFVLCGLLAWHTQAAQA